MKILLIQPAKALLTISGEDVRGMPEPLALEYIASGVVKNHQVRILDMRIEKDLESVLRDFRPDVVGITAYTVHVNTAKRLFHEIKAWNPDVFTVVGGHHATVSPEDFLTPFVDVIVTGEGIFVFQKLMERLAKRESFNGIPGIIFKQGNVVLKTAPEPLSDLDIFPFPERSLTSQYRKRYYYEWMKPLAFIRTSKGCPFRCSFCSLWKLTGGQYLGRNPENIVKEIARIDEPFVFFADDESLVDFKRMYTLARLLKEAGIRKKYFLYGRSDTIARHPDLLKTWRDIGLERVFLGLEFFRDEDLKFISKGSMIKDNEAAVRILQDLGIEMYASLIVRPEFRKEDFTMMQRYCRNLALNYATFSVLTPLPGTDYYELEKSRLITHDYDCFDFVHTLLPTTLPLKDFYEELYHLYQKAFPIKAGLSYLRKFPVREVPAVLVKVLKTYNHIRNAYKDYNCSHRGIRI